MVHKLRRSIRIKNSKKGSSSGNSGNDSNNSTDSELLDGDTVSDTVSEFDIELENDTDTNSEPDSITDTDNELPDSDTYTIIMIKNSNTQSNKKDTKKDTKKDNKPDRDIQGTTTQRTKFVQFKNTDTVQWQFGNTIENIDTLIQFGLSYEMKYKGCLTKQLCSEQLWNYRKQVYQLVPALIKLNNMIGMSTLKSQMVRQIKYFIQGHYNNEPNGLLLHTVITGEPGHGKSEVAHIVGELYRRLGFLKNNTFINAKQDDLIAGYIGQTAIKTREVLTSALGGVLFIDEVYSLSSGNNGENVGFSKECIDTINEFLYEHKNDFVCIIAGYKDEIFNRFFALNSGLERRFPFIYTIDKYTPNELCDVYIEQINRCGWTCSHTDIDSIRKLFKDNSDIITHGGGDTENLLTMAKFAHADTIFSSVMSTSVPSTNSNVITIEDTTNAFAEMRLRKKVNTINTDIPNHIKLSMYT
jgi:hypothetical protein